MLKLTWSAGCMVSGYQKASRGLLTLTAGGLLPNAETFELGIVALEGKNMTCQEVLAMKTTHTT